MKAVISQERERERAERERRRVVGKAGGGGSGGSGGSGRGGRGGREDVDAMDVDPMEEGENADGEEVPTCNVSPRCSPFPSSRSRLHAPDTSIEAPPSIWPPKHYCDITGLEVRTAPRLFIISLRPHVYRLHTRIHPLVSDSTTRAYTISLKASYVTHFSPHSPVAHTLPRARAPQKTIYQLEESAQ